MKTDAFPEIEVPLNSEETCRPFLLLLNNFSVFTMDCPKKSDLKKTNTNDKKICGLF